MLLLGLSSSHKLGLALTAAAFVGFSLIAAMVIPRWRPQFPGRGLPLFLGVSAVLFVGMLTAVEIFGRESESKAAGPSVKVTEVDYKIRPARTSLTAGTYIFEVTNQGKVAHNLTVTGPGGSEGTPTTDPGKSATLIVDLKPGTYELFCSVPGHKQLGMDTHLKVS